jgi:hypothetical protein
MISFIVVCKIEEDMSSFQINDGCDEGFFFFFFFFWRKGNYEINSQIRSVVDEDGSSSSNGIKSDSSPFAEAKKKESLKCYPPTIHTHFALLRHATAAFSCLSV